MKRFRHFIILAASGLSTVATPRDASAIDPTVTAIAMKVLSDPAIIGRKLNSVPFEMPNVITKTLGGEVFWTTVDSSRGWKMQCHKVAGNCRVLDPDDYRFIWGGKDSVGRAFDVLKQNGMVFYGATGLPDIQATMGGKVFWDDLASQGGWRIQLNKLSEHCRVLDGSDNRIAWGRCEDLFTVFVQMVGVPDPQ